MVYTYTDTQIEMDQPLERFIDKKITVGTPRGLWISGDGHLRFPQSVKTNSTVFSLFMCWPGELIKSR